MTQSSLLFSTTSADVSPPREEVTPRFTPRRREVDPDALEVLGCWLIPLTKGTTAYPVTGQVTKIRVHGVVGWVRENRRTSSRGHFCISSNERLRTKQEGKGIQVLELAADPRHWKMLAEHVEAVDALSRPVVKHARWTLNTAVRPLLDRRRIR
jgi:hypothetical protein